MVQWHSWLGSSTSFCIMGWWARAAFMVNHLKLQNIGGWHLSWRWWPFSILSTNLSEVMLLHLSKNFTSVSNFTTEGDAGDEVKDCNTSGMSSPWPPFFLQSVELVDTQLQLTSCHPDNCQTWYHSVAPSPRRHHQTPAQAISVH